jgi:hypothetical protein
VNVKRVALGTYLLLREALLVNSESVFRLDAVASDGALSDVEFASRLLATSVVLLAIEYFEETCRTGATRSDTDGVPSVEDLFLQASEAYDYGDDEFARHLTPIDDSYEPVHPMGQKLDGFEKAAWNLTFNVQRSRHSILHQRVESTYGSSSRMFVPEVTSAHITILEEQRN